MSGAPGRRKRSTSVLLRTGYFPMLPAWLVPGPTLPWVDGLRESLFLSRWFMPVVAPGFIILPVLSLVAPGPTLPCVDAPGAGWVCADATAVAPNSAATTRAESASLDRITGFSFRHINDAPEKRRGCDLVPVHAAEAWRSFRAAMRNSIGSRS